jgi:hypothetical protein
VGSAAPPPPSAGASAPYVPRQVAPAQQAYATPKRNNAAIFAAVAGVACLGLAGTLLVKSGVLGAKPTGGSSGVINSPRTEPARPGLLTSEGVEAKPGGLITHQPVNPPAPEVLTPADNPGSPMPDDVIAYLRWLKNFHNGLGDLNAQLEQVTIMLFPDMIKGIMDQASETEVESQPKAPDTKAPTARLSEVTQKLNNAAAMFQKTPPPNACAPLAQSYNTSLTVQIQQVQSMVSMLGEIIGSFSNPDAQAGADARMQKLTGLMQEKSSKGLSQNADALVLSADTQLNALRARYTNIPPDIDAGQFRIKPLNSGFDPSKLMGGGGIPGM